MSKTEKIQAVVDNEQLLEKLGGCLSSLLGQHLLLTLEGELGAGKTTLVRGLLHRAGYSGAVKSPTFSLVEPYELISGKLFHFDLYRLKDPEELEYIGMREYLSAPALSVVEWPEKAGDFLPVSDIHIMIKRTGQGREVNLQAQTEHGRILIGKDSIKDCWSSIQGEASA
jgi:tRNA threonylcarbamoyladenosine biosynthesis protein TsaE